MESRVTSTGFRGRAMFLAVIVLACSGGSDAPVVPVVVVPTVTTVVVSAPRTSLFEGDSVDFQASVRDAAGAILTGRAISWSTSDPTVATIGSTGRVNAVRVGSATVTATVEGKSGSASVTVSNIPVATVALSATDGSVFTGDTTRVTATVRDSVGRALTGRAIAWSVSDATRASISSTGTFRGIAPGPVTVVATSEGKSGSASITVVLRVVASVTITAPSTTPLVDGTVQLTGTARDVNGAVLAAQSIAWEVSDTTSARVSSTGLFTALLPGATDVRATSQGIKGTVTMTVRAPTIAAAANGLTGHFSGFADDAATRVAYGFGFSMFSTIYPVKPGMSEFTQLGWGTFMVANNIEDANGVVNRRPDNVCAPGASLPGSFQSNEGGVGSWGDIRFPTTLPKYAITATANCYTSGVGGPAYSPGGGTPLATSDLYFAQLSNRLLLPPDRVNFVNPTTAALFGYGWIALPLIPANMSPHNVPTGGNSWTLFMQTANFKGPVGFFTPAFWTAMNAVGGTSAGYGLDVRGAIYSQLDLEIGFTLGISATMDGVEYRRIPRITFGADASRRATLIQDVNAYSKAAVWNGVSTWLAGGAPVTQFNAGGRLAPNVLPDNYGGRMLDGDGQPILFNGMIQSAAFTTAGGGRAFGMQWGTTAEPGVIPEYYKKVSGRWTAIPAAEVPRRTWLADQTFPAMQRGTITPLNTSASSPWSQSTWAAGPFSASLSDGSTVQYVWYRFIDQPAIARLPLSAQERTRIQAWVESVHSQGTNGFTLAPPTSGTLVTIDPGHLVTPPPGMSVGYVPIVIRQP